MEKSDRPRVVWLSLHSVATLRAGVPLFVEPRGLSLSRPLVNGGQLWLDAGEDVRNAPIGDRYAARKSSVAGDDAPCCRRVSRREVLLAQGDLDLDDGCLCTPKNNEECLQNVYSFFYGYQTSSTSWTFFPAQIPSRRGRMALCSTTTKTRAAIWPDHPPRPCWPRLFHFATVVASDPGRVSNPHTTSDSGRHIARRSDHTMSLRCLFLPFATTCHRVARDTLSSACPLLTLPSAVLHHPLSYPRPPPGLASLCQCVKSRPKPAAPPCPRPGRRCRRQSGSSFPLPPSPPPWYHLTASPAGNPRGLAWCRRRLAKNLHCPIWSTAPSPFRPLPPGGTLSLQHQVIYQGPRIMIGVA